MIPRPHASGPSRPETVMAPPYTLRCLGAVEFRSPGGDLVRFRTRKHLALLTYLAVEPRHPHRRDRLADLLWPHASASEARDSVATALSVLRGKLGPHAFEAGRDEVRFVFPDLELDLDRLTRGEVLGGEFTLPLEVGGFLDGLEILGAPDFMLWREQQRARWLPAIRDAAIRLMDHWRRTGSTRRIEVVADSLLALDDLSEDAVRAKMEARAMAGDRVGALRIFEEWRLRLAEELGAEPAPLLENMANRLRRRGWEAGHPPAIPVSQTAQWRNQIFVGRAAEYRWLYESWERTLKQRPRHALVLGESGIGKTTLVERLVTAASLEGAVSVRAHCYEVERQIPYAAIGALVRGLLDRPGAAATAPEQLAELGRIVPEIRQRFAHLPQPPESQGETARLLLTEATHQLATAVAEECPLILVVDDVHLVDDVSVAVLHLIMRRVAEQRIMVVLAAREAELVRAPQASLLLENRAALGLETLELSPLSEEESVELVDHLARDLNPAPPPPVRRALVVAAAGNPMVLELLFRDWQANASDCLALGVSAMTVEPGVRGQEDTYRALLDRTFRDLDPETRGVLNLASILGSRMNDLRMYQSADLSLGQAMAGLARLTDRRVLRDQGGKLEFRNELIRAYAYLQVPSPLRRALHGMIADRLLTAEREGEWIPGLELAWHCVRSGRETQAIPYLLRGAHEALQAGTPFEAERALDRALGQLTGQAFQRATLLLAESYLEQDRAGEAIRLLERVTPLAPEAARQLLFSRATVMAQAGASPYELSQLRNELVATLRDEAAGDDRARAALVLARLAPWLGGRTTSAELLQVVQSLPLSNLDLAGLAQACCGRTRQAYHAGRKDRVSHEIVRLEQISAQLNERGYWGQVGYAVAAHLGSAFLITGHYEKALTTAQKALQLAERRGNRYDMASQMGNIALALGRLGRYKEQHHWASLALREGSGSSDVVTSCKAAYYVCLSKALLGEEPGPTELLHQHIGQSPPATADWVRQAHALLRADILILLGRCKEAKRVAADAIATGDGEPLSEQYRGAFARWLAIVGTELFSEKDVRERLRQMMTEIETLDLVDRAELLAASDWFGRRTGEMSQAECRSLEETFVRLPPPVRHQVARLLPD